MRPFHRYAVLIFLALSCSLAAAADPAPLSVQFTGDYYMIDPGTGDFGIFGKVQSGQLRSGTDVDAVSAQGVRKTVRIVAIEKEKYSGRHVPAVGPADGEVHILGRMLDRRFDNFSSTAFVLVGKGAARGGATVAAAPAAAPAAACSGTVTIDGQAWPFTGCEGQHWLQGNSMFFADKGPYLMLKLSAGGDSLVANAFTGRQAAAKLPREKLEVLFTGRHAGIQAMYGHKSPGLEAPALTLDITEYKVTGAGSALVSGKLAGKLRRSLCAECRPEVTINATVNNLPVRVYTQR